MYDLIIIGAGTAGIAAYKEAIKYSQNILIINDGPWDTTCARVGCMPSKVLISTANRRHEIRTASTVALAVNAKIDTSKVMQHVRQLRDRFTQATLKDVHRWEKSHKVSGKAQFTGSDTVQVNQKKYQAKRFIIAVGSTPTFDQELKAELSDLLITSDQVFELETLPKRLAVIGSGVIAIELAQAMQRLGVMTTVFARSEKVGSVSSPVLQKMAQQTLAEELNIKFKILPDQVQKFRNKVKIKYIEDQQQQTLIADYLLVATGRESLLKSLDLQNIDIQFDDLKALPIDHSTKQLGNYPIFVVGDAYTQTPIQHEAAHEARLAVQNCFNFPKIKPINTLTPLGIMFSSPEMAGVGQNYKQLREQKIDFITGFVSYEKQGRAIVLGKNKGAIEIYVHSKTRKLLGAEFFVESAEHLAHMMAWMIGQNLTVDEVLQQPFYHPTLEEGLRTALKDARRQLDSDPS